MIRTILAAVIGMIVAGVAVGLVEFGNSQLFPFPPGFDMNDQAQIAAFVKTLPPVAFAVVIVGWAIGAFVGPLVAKKIAPAAGNRPAIAVAVIFLLFCVFNMFMLPHPIAFVVSALVVTPLSSFAAIKLSNRPAQ